MLLTKACSVDLVGHFHQECKRMLEGSLGVDGRHRVAAFLQHAGHA